MGLPSNYQANNPLETGLNRPIVIITASQMLISVSISKKPRSTPNKMRETNPSITRPTIVLKIHSKGKSFSRTSCRKEALHLSMRELNKTNNFSK